MDLSTQYIGLTLKNPVIVASSGLTKNIDQIKKCEQAGASAVVMKSIFEEQIRGEVSELEGSAMMHTEVMDYIRAEIEMMYGPRDFEKTIKQAKKSVSIPVIASINCYTSKWWVNYAKQLEETGADALELNIYVLPYDSGKSSYSIENIYLEIVQAVIQQVNIPIALKLSPYFTSFGNFAEKLDKQGVHGLVLFNRFIQPDININDITSSAKAAFDDPIGFSNTLRWVALLCDKLNLDIAASGNIRTAEDVIKQLLAGASAVQIASVLYQSGLEKIKEILDGITTWMSQKKFNAIADFKGKLSQENDPHSESFIRAQFIKTIAGME